MNAWKVIERVHYKEKLDSDPMPVILIANSFNGYGRGHDPSTVAKKIRRFLNQAEKFYGLGGGAAFNVNTMPHMVLNGKPLCISFRFCINNELIIPFQFRSRRLAGHVVLIAWC